MLTINGDRLWRNLMELAQIGATPAGGVSRVTLTEQDRQGRQWFRQRCTQLGCTVETDPMGNLFARRQGADPNRAAVLLGSHLDSQPTGGKFDGALGVLAALEVVETLNEHGVTTQAPLEVVSWTNEEGARFAPAMIGSGVFAGEFTLDYAYSREDRDGVRLGDALRDIGYVGDAPLGQRAFAATLELHIEQGPVLETAGKSIGIVTGVQGIRWYDLTLTGSETHAGPAPMDLRRDPVRALLPLLEEIYQIAERRAPQARVTIGDLAPHPGVRNTVPGTLKATLDLRHPDADVLAAMDAQLREVVTAADGRRGVGTAVEEIWYSPPVAFDPVCIAAVHEAVQRTGVSAMEMVSGAGHDSVYIARVAPTSMIFVPCKDGLSHNEAESIEPDQAEAGANVLLHAALVLADVAGEQRG